MAKTNGVPTGTVIDTSGTFLEELAIILNTRDFEPAPEEPVAEGEVVIGEMNDFEKACTTASMRFGKRADTMLHEAMDAAESPEEIRKAKEAAARRYNVFKAISDLRWANMKNRLGEACDEGSGIGIRGGYKIVTVPERKNNLPEGLPAELAELFGSMPGSVHIIGMGMGSPFGEEE
ncbi:MAG: hypothetical protein HGA31_02795 [Candidatus Moranbacteria bacterium]|nr:hypothetical protein [Candidatus Moranbacteria bacterium]